MIEYDLSALDKIFSNSDIESNKEQIHHEIEFPMIEYDVDKMRKLSFKLKDSICESISDIGVEKDATSVFANVMMVLLNITKSTLDSFNNDTPKENTKYFKNIVNSFIDQVELKDMCDEKYD